MRRDLATVAVVPARERRARARLFDALEAAYPVRFEGRDPGGLRGADGVYAIGANGAIEGGRPTLAALAEETDRAQARRAVVLARNPALPRPLHGARLSESRTSAPPLPLVAAGDDVLATLDDVPAWVVHGRHPVRQWVATAPADLKEGEALRNRLTTGRCLALLALIQFVRDLTAPHGWEVPPLRAAFVLDDPNLRWPSYGHVRYDELLASAGAHRYHVVIAMVPLDGWPVHPRAVRLFREGRAYLSICTHGNDHDGPELGRPRSQAEGLPLVAQATARTAAFQRRTGLTVDRVMVPPHERLSQGAAAALLACGFEALCHTRPYPWIEESPDLPWLTRPAGLGPLPGWGSAEVMNGGLPLLLRRAFDFDREDLAIRAYLGQPLIISGHHDLLEHGTAGLEEAAADVNRLGDVHWCSLGDIARSSFEARRCDGVLNVRVLSRRISVAVPPGVGELRLDLSAFPDASQVRIRLQPGDPAATHSAVDGGLPVDGPGPVEVTLPGALEPGFRLDRRVRLRPLARRLASEGRDRARPMVSKGGGR